MAPLRMNATVSDGRVTITFSHEASATNYFKYLKNLEKPFYKNHEFKFEIAEFESMVSMNLPSEITAEPRERPKDVVLAFNDPREAVEWESEMIVWEKEANQENKRRLSRSLTVEGFNKKLEREGLITDHEGGNFINFSSVASVVNQGGSRFRAVFKISDGTL
jgi:hypothetical protein